MNTKKIEGNSQKPNNTPNTNNNNNNTEILNEEITSLIDSYVIVQFDYNSDKNGHLKIKRGDIIKIGKKRNSGWWNGYLESNGNAFGKFPYNYTTPCPIKKLKEHFRTMSSNDPSMIHKLELINGIKENNINEINSNTERNGEISSERRISLKENVLIDDDVDSDENLNENDMQILEEQRLSNKLDEHIFNVDANVLENNDHVIVEPVHKFVINLDDKDIGQEEINIVENNNNVQEEIKQENNIINNTNIPKELTKQEKRTKLIEELLDTEKSYVAQLDEIQHSYDTIKKSQVIPDLQLNGIFLNVRVLRQLHKNLLSDIENALIDKNTKEKKEDPLIGEMVAQMVPYFKLYMEYVNRYDDGTALFNKLINEVPNLNKVLNNIEIKSSGKSQKGAFAIKNLRITPIQRIPRYVMLLQQILKYTTPEHPDFENLDKALISVTEVTVCIDKTKNDIIGFKRIGEISETLIGKDLSDLHEYIEGKAHTFNLFQFNKNSTCNYCNDIINKSSSAYRCTVCEYTCHTNCYLKVCPNCGEPPKPPSIIKEGRKLIDEITIEYYPNKVEKTDGKKIQLFLFNDCVLLATPLSQNELEFFDIIRWHSILHSKKVEVFITTPNVDDYFTIKNPYYDNRVHVIKLANPAKCSEFFEKLQKAISDWETNKEQTEQSIKTVKQPEKAVITVKSVPLKNKKGNVEQIDYSIEIAKNENTINVTRSCEQITQFHDSLKSIYNETTMPQLPFSKANFFKKFFGNSKEDYSEKINFYFTSLLKLHGILSLPIFLEFFQGEGVELLSPNSNVSVKDNNEKMKRSFSRKFDNEILGKITDLHDENSVTFENVMTKPRALFHFSNYLKNFGKVHLHEFFEESEQLRSIKGRKPAKKAAQKIYAKFISPNSTTRIVLSKEASLELTDSFETSKDNDKVLCVVSYQTVFNKAQREVKNALVETLGDYHLSNDYKTYLDEKNKIQQLIINTHQFLIKVMDDSNQRLTIFLLMRKSNTQHYLIFWQKLEQSFLNFDLLLTNPQKLYNNVKPIHTFLLQTDLSTLPIPKNEMNRLLEILNNLQKSSETEKDQSTSNIQKYLQVSSQKRTRSSTSFNSLNQSEPVLQNALNSPKYTNSNLPPHSKSTWDYTSTAQENDVTDNTILLFSSLREDPQSLYSSKSTQEYNKGEGDTTSSISDSQDISLTESNNDLNGGDNNIVENNVNNVPNSEKNTSDIVKNISEKPPKKEVVTVTNPFPKINPRVSNHTVSSRGTVPSFVSTPSIENMIQDISNLRPSMVAKKGSSVAHSGPLSNRKAKKLLGSQNDLKEILLLTQVTIERALAKKAQVLLSDY